MDEMKMERLRTSEAFLGMIHRRSKAMLGSIVTMDKSAVLFHTPETKQQSKQWLKKGKPGPIKAKVHTRRIKQIVLAFFDSKGLIYTNYLPWGTTLNAIYKLLEHPPYSPDLTSANFLLFPKVKKELGALTLTRETFKMEWEGAVRTLTAGYFAQACSSSANVAATSVWRSAAATLRKMALTITVFLFTFSRNYEDTLHLMVIVSPSSTPVGEIGSVNPGL